MKKLVLVGKPLLLSWQTRQHGVHPLGPGDGLHPTLEARSGSRVVRGTADAYAEEGLKGFRGTIVFLKDPSIKPATDGTQMPDLALREKEILPVIAFLTAEQRAAAR